MNFTNKNKHQITNFFMPQKQQKNKFEKSLDKAICAQYNKKRPRQKRTEKSTLKSKQ